MTWLADEFCDIGEHFTPKARKPHRCCECNLTIPPGVTYHRFQGLFDHSWINYKWCNTCGDLKNRVEKELRHKEGLVFEGLYEAAEELDYISILRRKNAQV